MPTPPPHPQLLDLPPHILDRILSLSLDDHPHLASTFISSLGKQLHHSFRRVAAAAIAITDDDAALVQAEKDNDPPGGPRSSLLSAVWGDPTLASNVHQLTVLRPVVSLTPTTDSNGDSSGNSSNPDDDLAFDDFSVGPTTSSGEVPIPPLEDSAFYLLLSKLNHLTSFTWRSYRPPPDQLCPALGAAAKELRVFQLDLLPSPFPDAGDATAAPGSPQLGAHGHGHGHGHGHHGHAAHARWDAPLLSSLPGGLTTLSLSALSQAGCKALGGALPSFLALEALELARTLFVDDALLAEIGQGAARTLRRVVIAEMGGTKLSEVGLGEVLKGCEGLEVLELDAVEGRLSRTCWSKLSPLPSTLHTLKLIYSESSPHKSWVLDHLASLPSLLTSSSLTSLTLSRRVPHPSALLPGSHQPARFPIDPVVSPRTLGKKEVAALVERAEAWENLELDLFAVDQDGLRKILENCTSLRRLRVLFDGPFRNILTLDKAFASAQALRHFLVSIPPDHAPEIASLTPTVYASALARLDSSPAPCGSPSNPAASLPDSSELARSPSSPSSGFKDRDKDKDKKDKSPSGLHLKELDALLPATRDWRRFLKKTHALERVSWTGRGGVGAFRFHKPEGSSLVRVEFAPTRPGEGAEEPAPGGEEGRSPTLGRRLSLSASPSVGAARPRRRSSVSLAGSCLSGLSLSPTSATAPSPFSSPVSASGSGASQLFTPSTSYTSFSAAGSGAGGDSDTRTSPKSGFSPFGGDSGGAGGGAGGSWAGHRRRSTTTSSASSSASASAFFTGAGFPHAGGALGLGGMGMHAALPPVEDELDAPTAVGWASPPEPVPDVPLVRAPQPPAPAPPTAAAHKNFASAVAQGKSTPMSTGMTRRASSSSGGGGGGGGGKTRSGAGASESGWASPPSPTATAGRKKGQDKEGSPTQSQGRSGRWGGQGRRNTAGGGGAGAAK
ncbi:hypothetical protein JCM10207_007800 [Rhodosporidiobolus poonsookiae]